ncbi:Kinase, NEK [Giardia duodenalis]|uniref:Kinase, NEK n=1 Tax=Giardia intestinalis (strain ATCC 50803 / WB clone C6) TaxID=184922 RepID=A8C035_GIAIC|nr:Kinase, NEK [Giardia intestinalis]KAE8302561.1 Kinase, NEK [Giardia intestinalis]|eukprot:XP_001703936.1 Kinase, NEK [Giardia lamblia ATCC 50803]
MEMARTRALLQAGSVRPPIVTPIQSLDPISGNKAIMADGSNHAFSLPAAASTIPQFALRDLHEWLDSVLNESTTGTVYSLRGHPSLAVKKVPLDGLGKGNVDAIRLELATLPDLSHPGVLRYHQVIEDEGFIYIVMNRHDKTLEQVFIDCKRRKTPVSPELILSILRQLAAALAYLHSVSVGGTRGLVHRDLKLANVLVSADGEHFIIADFGLCKDALRCGSTIAGTAVYMAPEVLLHNEASPASDVWSLGVIIYELVTLRRPDFLGGKEPAEVFVDGWRPDLSGVADGFMQNVLERIFVLEPERRLTAKELCKMLTTSNVPVNELGHRYVTLEGKCSALEAALNSANASITLLKNELKANSGRITALEVALDARSVEMVSQLTEIASLKEALETKAARIDALEENARAREDKVAALEQDLGVRSTKIDALEKDINTKTDRISALEKDLSAKSARIDALENQGQEHLATMRALEAKVMQLSDRMDAADPRSFLLLPRLIRAAHMNSTETVRVLLEERVCTGQRDKQKMTALMHAAQQGHGGPVELLVKKEKGLKDKNGWTALMHAIHNSHSKVAKILVPHEHGKRSNNGRTALVMAVANSCVETVRALAEFEHGLRDSHGHTALMIAAEKGHTEIASLLVPYEKGLTDSKGRTALMIAAQQGSLEMAKILLDHEKGLRDKQHHNALYHALENGHLRVAEMIIPYEDPIDENGVTALMRAVARGDTDMVRLFIPVQGGMKDKDGNTAFVHALKNKHTSIALLLREHEAPSWTPLMCASFTGDVTMVRRHFHERDVKNSDGETALTIAARAGHKDIVELLDPTDENGVTALMRAVDRNDLMAVKALLPLQGGQREFGSFDIDDWIIMRNGTALMRAAAHGHTRIVEILLEKEGGMRGSYGWTALMIAAWNNKQDCVKLLVKHKRERGALGWTNLICAACIGDADAVRSNLQEASMRGSNGWTALMLAAANGYSECAKLLLEKEGCMQRSYGQTALILAARKGHPDCIKLFLEKEGGMADYYGWTALMWAVSCNQIECVRLLAEKEKNINRRKLLDIAKGNSEMMALLSE